MTVCSVGLSRAVVRLISAAPVTRRGGQLGRCVALAHGCCRKLTGKLIDLLSYRYRFRRLHTPTHTHTPVFTAPFSGTTWVSRYQKGKTNVDFTEARDSEWQWH